MYVILWAKYINNNCILHKDYQCLVRSFVGSKIKEKENGKDCYLLQGDGAECALRY